MIVHLSDIAFTGIVVAAVESFQKECYGLLLGQRTQDAIVVQHSIPYQTADRHSNWVQRDESAHQRMHKLLSNLVHLDLLGDFHSHTQYGNAKPRCMLSLADHKGMIDGGLYLVVAVHKRGHYQRWRENTDLTLSGTIEDFFLKIGAWYQDEYAHKVRIKCPLAVATEWR